MPERKQAPSESASAPVTQRGNESCLEMENSPNAKWFNPGFGRGGQAGSSYTPPSLKTAVIDPPAACPSENNFSITGQSPHTDPMSGWPDNSAFKRPACLPGRTTWRGWSGITKTVQTHTPMSRQNNNRQLPFSWSSAVWGVTLLYRLLTVAMAVGYSNWVLSRFSIRMRSSAWTLSLGDKKKFTLIFTANRLCSKNTQLHKS